MTKHTNDSQTARAEVREWEHSASVCAGCSHCVSVAPLVGLLPLLLSVVPLGLHHRTCADIPVTNSDQHHNHLDSDTTHYTRVLPTVAEPLTTHYTRVLPTVAETLTTQSNTHSLTIHRKSPCLINTTPVQNLTRHMHTALTR